LFRFVALFSEMNRAERDKSSSPEPDLGANLWPESRKRRERAVGRTARAWLLLGLRVLIFVLVIGALLILTRVV
jgi:hypothetical protein